MAGKVTITRGMLGALSALEKRRGDCMNCNVPIPVYPGRYPKRCPNCSEPLVLAPSRDPLESASPGEWEEKVRPNFSYDDTIDSVATGEVGVHEAVDKILRETTTCGAIATVERPLGGVQVAPVPNESPEDRDKKLRLRLMTRKLLGMEI